MNSKNHPIASESQTGEAKQTVSIDVIGENRTRKDPLSWFKICLTSRYFKVIVNDQNSENCNMKHRVAQYNKLGPAFFNAKTITLQWSYNMSNPFCILMVIGRIHFKHHSNDNCVSHLNTVLNGVLTWIFAKKFKLNKEKKIMMVVCNPLLNRSFDLPSNLTLNQSDDILSTKSRNLELFQLKSKLFAYQVVAVKKLEFS